MDEPGIPFWPLELLLFGIPFAIALLCGMVAFKHLTSNLYECQRCGHQFQRRPYRRYPPKCTRCRAVDWSRRRPG